MNHMMVAMDFLISAVRFVFLLGVLIFVHELGHYIAAKMCNVYVVRFSFGWGKRLFGIRRRETDYCISAIPIGGYVKMVGQEDTPRTQEEAAQIDPETVNVPPERRFDTQPAMKKLLISFAGPFMNLVFALPVLWVVFIVGIQTPIFSQHTRIGEVTKGSPADLAGIRPGERILSIDGEPVKKWEEVQLKIWTSENKPLDLELQNLDGKITHRTVTPVREEGSSMAETGITPLAAEGISRVFPGMAAAESGLEEGDIILTYNHETADNETMGKLIESVNDSGDKPMVLTVLRDDHIVDITVTPKTVSAIDGVGFHNNLIAYVDPKQAEATGLQTGDVVTAVNGEPLNAGNHEDVLAKKIYGQTNDTVNLTVERHAGLFQKPERLNLTVPLTRKGMIGVLFSPFTIEKLPPDKAFIKSFDAFGNSFALVMKTIYYLVSGKVSSREMAGPIGIAVLTEQSLTLGIGYYLNLVAFITINLAIINLFPVPILDGGMIMLVLIESIRGKPLEEKYLIFLQKVGVVFILLLIFVATYNDVIRIINWFMGGGFME